MIKTSAVLLFISLVSVAQGLYFHIAETERKCFIEEIPDETTVIGNFLICLRTLIFIKLLYFLVNYKVELYDPRSGGFMPSSPGIGMHVEVKDPDDKLVLSRVYSSEGKLHVHCTLRAKLNFVYFRSNLLHLTHTRRTRHLHVLQLDGLVQWLTTPRSLGYPGRRACHRLRKRRPEGETHRAAAPHSSAAGSSRTDHERTKLPALPRRALPTDQREHQQARAVLVAGTNRRAARDGPVADETSQVVLRGEETRVESEKAVLDERTESGVMQAVNPVK